MFLNRAARAFAALAGFVLVSGCATAPEQIETDGSYAGRTPQWAANGYLTPGPTNEPEIIGLYLTEDACKAALEDWLSRQVVGNPVSGECLPIDHH